MFDEDPFLIFKLRGRTKEEIIQTLRQKRGQTLDNEEPKAAEVELFPESTAAPLEDCLINFWQAGEALDSFVTNPAPPEIEVAILKRLGNPPATIGGQGLTTLLAKAYSIASKSALQSASEKPTSKKK